MKSRRVVGEARDALAVTCYGRYLSRRLRRKQAQKHSITSQAFISGTCSVESWSGSE
jgi:hypothetical protein